MRSASGLAITGPAGSRWCKADAIALQSNPARADRESTMIESNPNASAAPPRLKGRESPLRIGSYLSCGAVAIYLATWVGAVAFHVTFQQPLLALERGPNHGVLWLEPGASAATGAEKWATDQLEGMDIPVPPARVVERKADKASLWLKLEGSDAGQDAKPVAVLIEQRPIGFLKSVEREKLEFLGFKCDETLTDASVLVHIARGTLQTYRFGWSEAERLRYAARLLVKMAIWDTGPIARFELAGDESACAVLVEKPGGESKVIRADSQGVMIATLPPGSPPAWLSPASWLGK